MLTIPWGDSSMMVIPRHKDECAEQIIENMRPDNGTADSMAGLDISFPNSSVITVTSNVMILEMVSLLWF